MKKPEKFLARAAVAVGIVASGVLLTAMPASANTAGPNGFLSQYFVTGQGEDGGQIPWAPGTDYTGTVKVQMTNVDKAWDVTSNQTIAEYTVTVPAGAQVACQTDNATGNPIRSYDCAVNGNTATVRVYANRSGNYPAGSGQQSGAYAFPVKFTIPAEYGGGDQVQVAMSDNPLSARNNGSHDYAIPVAADVPVLTAPVALSALGVMALGRAGVTVLKKRRNSMR